MNMIQFLLRMSSTKSRFRKDLESLRSAVNEQLNAVIPWSREEMELLSTQSDYSVKKGFFSDTITGKISNIYHEPVFAYSAKKYKGDFNRTVVIVRSSSDEYAYLLMENESQITINGNLVGVLDSSGNLNQPRSRTLLAKLKSTSDKKISVILGNRKYATITLPGSDKRFKNERAIQLFESIDESQEDIIQALAILQIIKN